MTALLRRDHRASYKEVLTSCGCNPTERDQKLTYNCPTTLQKSRR